MSTSLEQMVGAEINNLDCYCNVEDVISDFSENLITCPTIKQIRDAVYKHSRGTKNRCVECGEDMGECNPRQLCSKTFCSTRMLSFE